MSRAARRARRSSRPLTFSGRAPSSRLGERQATTRLTDSVSNADRNRRFAEGVLCAAARRFSRSLHQLTINGERTPQRERHRAKIARIPQANRYDARAYFGGGRALPITASYQRTPLRALRRRRTIPPTNRHGARMGVSGGKRATQPPPIGARALDALRAPHCAPPGIKVKGRQRWREKQAPRPH